MEPLRETERTLLPEPGADFARTGSRFGNLLHRDHEAIADHRCSGKEQSGGSIRNPHPDFIGSWRRPVAQSLANSMISPAKHLSTVDWDCEVKTLFSDKNLGCKVAVSRAIDWFFEHVEEGIILEDDCLPHPTFFRFCEELLNKYRDDERIGQISGDNFQFGKKRTEYSYYFSRYTLIWGWATWRRAWKNYDVDMKSWPEIHDNGWLQDWLGNKKLVHYWMRIFEMTYQGEINTWDYQWTFTCWIRNCLTILPNVNLISNIGFSAGGTHTSCKNDKSANIPVEAMEFPLRHPPFMSRDSSSDKLTEKRYLVSFVDKVKDKIREIIN